MVDRTKFPAELLTEVGREGAQLLLKDKRFQVSSSVIRKFFGGYDNLV